MALLDDDDDAGDAGERAVPDDVAMLEIDGELVEYFPPGVEIPLRRVAGLEGYEYRKDALVGDHPRLRRVVVRLHLATDVLRAFGVLRWTDAGDATLLDELVAAGLDTADPELLAIVLDGALFCTVHGVTCRVCHSSSMVATTEAGMPVSSLPRARRHVASHRCPVCGDDRYIGHYEVLE